MRRTTNHLVSLTAALLCALALIVAPGSARADALDDAKAAGQVGERFDGYLGLVNPGAPDAVKQLVSDINAKRRERYAEIAKKRGTSVEAVAKIAGAEVLEEKVAKGHYYLADPKAGWQRR